MAYQPRSRRNTFISPGFAAAFLLLLGAVEIRTFNIKSGSKLRRNMANDSLISPFNRARRQFQQRLMTRVEYRVGNERHSSLPIAVIIELTERGTVTTVTSLGTSSLNVIDEEGTGRCLIIY